MKTLFFPILNKKVRVTNSDYVNGGYEGKIIGYKPNFFLVDCPFENQVECWEEIKNCKFI